MSGPIVRKYGFPNFDDIFGKRELQHGVDEGEAAEKSEQAPAPTSPEGAPRPAGQEPGEAKAKAKPSA